MARPHVLLSIAGAWVAALALVLAAAASAAAQAPDPRLEIGAHVSAVRLGDAGDLNAGLGGRASYDLTPWLAVEFEGTVFPNEAFDLPGTIGIGAPFSLRHRRTRVEAFFGPKVGVRGERVGGFVRLRSGWTRAGDAGIDCRGPACPLILVVRPEYRNELAFDIGGGLELYPTARTVVRLDLGDLLIRHRSQAPPCRDCTTHNFHSRLGFGVRF